MQTKNWDSQQVLSSFYPFPEAAKKPLCVEHHIFLTGQLWSGIFSVPWLKLTKGSNEVFFAKPRQQQRVQRAQLFHSKTTKHVHFPKDLYVTGRKGCGQAWAVSECLTYISLSKISQVTFYRSCLCVFYTQLEIPSPVWSMSCHAPSAVSFACLPPLPWLHCAVHEETPQLVHGGGRWWSSTALAVPAHPAPAGGGSPWMHPVPFE